jgi:DNA modification methylase
VIGEMRGAMTYTDPLVTLHVGDSLDVLATLEPESAHMTVSSPPYWGLRKYEGETGRVWGDSDCQHEWDSKPYQRRSNDAKYADTSAKQLTNVGSNGREAWIPSDTCSRCDAWRGSFGLEPLHDCLGWARGERCNVCYVCHSLVFLDAIKRVLRKDGVVFWNLGDSYAGSSGSGGKTQKQSTNTGSFHDGGIHIAPGLKPKDMVLVPQRIALAAQASGWWVRSDIIWAKPNPMPESTRDRPTSSYEHILLLARAGTYYWDAEAVREAYRGEMYVGRDNGTNRNGDRNDNGKTIGMTNPAGRNIRDVWTIVTQPFSDWTLRNDRQALGGQGVASGGRKRIASPDCPVHVGRPGLAANDADGGHAAEGRQTRTERSRTRRAEGHVGDFGSTPQHHGPESADGSLDSVLLEHSASATDRSIGTHRTGHDPETNPAYTPSAETLGHTERNAVSQGSAVSGRDMPLNMSLEGFGVDEMEITDAQKVANTPRKCTCSWEDDTREVSHFATYPEAIPDRAIRAGTSEHGVCSACGAPWIREVETVSESSWERRKADGYVSGSATESKAQQKQGSMSDRFDRAAGGFGVPKQTRPIGWSPSCSHAAPIVPATVLDPFAGSGTSLAVAKRLGRRAVGIEISESYAKLAMKRIEGETARLL